MSYTDVSKSTLEKQVFTGKTNNCPSLLFLLHVILILLSFVDKSLVVTAYVAFFVSLIVFVLIQ